MKEEAERDLAEGEAGPGAGARRPAAAAASVVVAASTSSSTARSRVTLHSSLPTPAAKPALDAALSALNSITPKVCGRQGPVAGTCFHVGLCFSCRGAFLQLLCGYEQFT